MGRKVGPDHAGMLAWAVDDMVTTTMQCMGRAGRALSPMAWVNSVTHRSGNGPPTAAVWAAGATAAVMVAAAGPALESRVEVQNEAHHWRLTARAFVAAETLGGPEKAAYTVDASILPRPNLVRAHFENATRQSEDFGCLSRAVFYEAGTESVAGQLAVAEVILNRVRHRLYPNTICDVIYEGTNRETGLSIFGTRESCQFSFTCDGSEDRPRRGRNWERAQSVTAHVLMGLAPRSTTGATHYHADYVDPYWAPSLVQTDIIGAHIFYRFPNRGDRRA